MRFLSVVRSFLWKCGCGLCNCINILLAFLAVLQTGLILLNSVRTVVPVPEFLIRLALDRTLHGTYQANWSQIQFDLEGGFFVENLELLDPATREIALTARSCLLKFDPLRLISGFRHPLDEMKASGVRIFLPSQFSLSGLNESPLAIENLSVREEDGKILLDALHLTSESLSLHASGQADLQSLATGGPSRFSRPALYNLLARVQNIPVEDPLQAFALWSKERDQPHQLKLSFILPQFNSSFGTAEQIHGSARFSGTAQSGRIRDFQAAGLLSSLQTTEIMDALPAVSLPAPLPFQISGYGDAFKLDSLSIPAEWALSLSSRQPLFHLQSARLYTYLAGQSDFALHWSFSGPGLFATGTAQPSPAPGDEPAPFYKQPLSIQVRAAFQNPRLHDFFQNLPDMRLLNGTSASFLRFQGQVLTRPFSATGFLVGDQLYTGETHFANIASRLSLDAANVALTGIHVQHSPGQSATGAYLQHFPSSQFSLQAQGQIFPATLDAILGNWWIGIFTEIYAPAPLPGDVTVWGQWREQSSLKSFTAAVGDGASWRGLRIPELEVRVRSDADWTYLEHLEGRFKEGMLAGKIGWRQGLPDEERRPMLVEFRSDMEWPKVVQASGLTGLERIRIAGHPEVEAKGTLYRPPKSDRDLPVLPDLRIRLNADEAACEINNLSLEDLNFRGRVTPEVLDLPMVSGDFAEGVFTGSVRVYNYGDWEAQRRHLNIQLFDADFSQSLEELLGLLDRPAEARSAVMGDDFEGRVDANFDILTGPLLSGWEGNGQVTVRNGNIGRIHLFGGLSRFLSNVGIGFSSLDLTAGSMEWFLDNSMLSIPNCFITGPVLNLEVEGNVDLTSSQLDLQAEAALFRGLVSQMLAPVSENFQFDLTGTLRNPSWQVRLSPLKWFQNRLQISTDGDSL